MSNQGLRGITPDLKNGISRYSFVGYTAPSSGVIRLSLLDVGKRITINTQIAETFVILPRLYATTLDRNIIICNTSTKPLKIYRNGSNGSNFAAFLTIVPPKSSMLLVCTSIYSIVDVSTTLYGTWATTLVGTSPINTSSILLTATSGSAFTYCKLIMFDDSNGVLVGSSAAGTIGAVVWLTSGSNIAISSLTTLSGNSVGTFAAAKLSSNSIIIATSTSNYGSMNTQVVTVNLDGAMSFNTLGVVFNVASAATYNVLDIVALSATQAVLSFILFGASEQYKAAVISITGTTCSVLGGGSSVGINGTGTGTAGGSKAQSIPLTSSSWLWLFDNYNAGNLNTHGIVCTISGSTVTYNGTPVNIGLSLGGFEAIANSATQVLVLGCNNTGYPLFVVISISGTTVSTTTSKSLSSYGVAPKTNLMYVSNNTALALVRNSSDASLRIYIVLFSSTTVDIAPYELIIAGSGSDTMFGLASGTSGSLRYFVYNKSAGTNQPTITPIKLA
jgi:hypothetical protein